jgi:hypothetical protein
MNTPKPKVFTQKRFEVAMTLDGYEVCDRDGRPVTQVYDHATALQACSHLNHAAGHPKTLAVALGCIDDDIEMGLVA